ncbi:fumarylacetoacetate hydrolase family protein [uncultured Cocleimonas sp.]|uniref:fumarylacetoacetate hydrolase family protein n=1 Tax=uncultured Cocleimonas sp. TaxID=1051587 RepID=UPI00262A2D4A|nr:fumarylacetoacetate hydrolase family protein [uncultured Cocleimonas sp.]
MKTISCDGKDIIPSKIICIGRNYVEHIQELDNAMPDEPVIFLKPNSAISHEIVTHEIDAIHYEAEISFLVHDKQLSAVGFGLDLTKREVQSNLKGKGLPWERAKAFDNSAVLSDFKPFDGDIHALRLELFINGELIQYGGTPLMLYKPSEILEEVSKFMTIADNDIIMTGTPKGVGVVNKGDVFVGKIFENDDLLVDVEWQVQ